MHKILCALALTMIPPSCAPSHAQEALKVEHKDDGSVVLTIPAEAVAQCVKEGGCQLWSNEAVLEVAQKAVKAHCAKEI